MTKINKLINQEIAPPSLITLLFLTFAVLTREFGRLTELLIRADAPILTVVRTVLSILPSILVFSVPLSFLIGTLIGFSRLSTDSEIVAMRACGIGVHRMVRHVVNIGLLVSLLTVGLTLVLLPAGNWSLQTLRHEIGVQPVLSRIKPRVFYEGLPKGWVLYAADVDLRNGFWNGVFLSNGSDAETEIVLSRGGEALIDEDKRRIQLHLEDGLRYKTPRDAPEKMTLSRFRILDFALQLPPVEQNSNGPRRPEDKAPTQLWREIRSDPGATRDQSWLELNRRLALAVSPLIFAVLGVALGARNHRGGRGYGLVASVVVALAYYVLFATGFELARGGMLHPLVGVWGTNLLTGLLAWATFRYGALDAKPLRWRQVYPHLDRKLTRAAQGFRRMLSTIRSSSGFQPRRSRLIRMRPRVARVIDLYLAKTFLLYSFLALSVTMALFYLFTFFDLIDDVLEFDSPYGLLISYFFYLAPHILMLLVPLSVLIGTLVTFGLLDKTGQITALKACGVSVYRVSLSVLGLTLLVGTFLYVLQEYVLPYANQRQDNLRTIIKGRPVQTFYQQGRNWIFGEGKRLYHYNYFDAQRGLFGDLSILDLDIREGRLKRHVYSQKAAWDRHAGRWVLSQGWIRDLEHPERKDFVRFESRDFELSEGPEYFAREVKESSKMTYPELSRYIRDLQQGGFEVDHLKTDLYAKLSLPLVTPIMAILGIPFAFSMGRKGALYGIAAGVLIGICYWGAFGIFGMMGANGLLSPLLAAWGPNLLFSTGAILLFSMVRT